MRQSPVYAGYISESDKRAAAAFVGQCQRCKGFKFKTELVEAVIESAEGNAVYIYCPRCVAFIEGKILRDARKRWGLDKTTAQFLSVKFKSSVSHTERSTRNRPHSLRLDDVFALWAEQHGMCAMTGTQMDASPGLKAASIDRIDSRIGYEKGNVHLVCWAVNLMKQTMTMQQLLHWASAITDYAAFNAAVGGAR